jgi:hypothetical protein
MFAIGVGLTEEVQKAHESKERLEKAKNWNPKLGINQCFNTEGGLLKISSIDKISGTYHGTLYIKTGTGQVHILSSIYFEDFEHNYTNSSCSKIKTKLKI